MTRVLGTDWSHWAGNVDVKKMYNAGSRWAIIKASDANRDTGWQWEDVRFDQYARQIFAHGQLLAGCYHWLQASVDPKVAADFYLERYKRFDFHFPPVMDFEEKSVFGKGLANHYVYCAEVWLDRVHRQTGRKPIIYTANWFTKQFDQNKLSFMGSYPLWVASYPWVWTPLSRPVMPGKIWNDWTMWQYSADNNGRGAEFGVSSTNIDLNWFAGSYDNLLLWLGTGNPAPTPPPDGGTYTILMTGSMSVRSGAGINNPIVRYVLKGDVLTGYELENGWYRIGVNEWISGGTQWTTVTYNEPEEEQPIYVGTVTQDTDILDKPGGLVIGRLNKNQDVNVREVQGLARHDAGWSDIRYIVPK